ncbi:MAG: SDR family NAD(P)-dependent oxidoreductase [Actinomycetota bacterium]
MTGGASGIGEATVRKLVRKGHAVASAELHEHEGRLLVSELGNTLVSWRWS